MHFFCSISGPDLANCLQEKQRDSPQEERHDVKGEVERAAYPLPGNPTSFVSEQFMLPARLLGGNCLTRLLLKPNPSPPTNSPPIFLAGNLLLVVCSLKVESSSNCLPGICTPALFSSYLICDWAEWANKLVARLYWAYRDMERLMRSMDLRRKLKYFILMES